MDGNNGKTVVEHMVLKHEVDRVALLRKEDSARTLADFENLVVTYDKLDKNRERRESNHERPTEEGYLMLGYSGGAIIPAPFGYRFWRQLLNGNFVDVIFDCPNDIQELITGRAVFELLKKLKSEQKEILYYWAVRQWTVQQLAVFRNQTNRNILKVYTAMMDSLRYKLYMRLLPRFRENLPLSESLRRFMENNSEKYGEGKPKRKRRKKSEMP